MAGKKLGNCVIAATYCDLRAAINEKKFREDLYSPQAWRGPSTS